MARAPFELPAPAAIAVPILAPLLFHVLPLSYMDSGATSCLVTRTDDCCALNTRAHGRRHSLVTLPDFAVYGTVCRVATAQNSASARGSRRRNA